MVRRSLGALLWILVGVMACFLGGLAALVGTGAGRTLLGHIAQQSLANVVAGQVEIGSVSGSVLTGVTLEDVKLYDPDSTLVAWLPHAELGYNLFDFAAGRISLEEVRLDRPYFNLVQHRNGVLNLEELLRLGGPSGKGPRQVIVFHNVRITDGNVVLRLQESAATRDSGLEIDPYGRDGRRRVRRFEHLSTRMAALRISSPTERGIRADLQSLAVRSTDPAVEISDARGHVVIDGDSLELDLPEVRLPHSQLALRGRLAWPKKTLRYDLAVTAAPGELSDVRFIDRKFPSGATLRGALTVRSPTDRQLEIAFDTVDLTYHRGRLVGRLTALIDADSGLTVLRQTDLTANDLDLSFPRLFLDTLPFFGHLSGRTIADGPLDSLALDADWAFRDSLVAGEPISRLRGHGRVGLLKSGIVFHPLAVDSATLDLGTVQRLLPAIALPGRLHAVGTLSGSLVAPHFEGSLRHEIAGVAPTVARGTLGVDGRRDTLGLDVDLSFDTLSWDGLAKSFSGFPLRGTAVGRARLVGRLDSLDTHVQFAMADGGEIQADGALILLPDRVGARGFELQGSRVDLRRWLDGAPPSRLGFDLTATLDVDTGSAPSGTVTAVLRPSVIAGTVVDSGFVRTQLADGRVKVDTLVLRQPGMRTVGSGALGWRRPDQGELLLRFDADSLHPLDSLVTWLTGADPAADSILPVVGGGVARLDVRIAGALDSLALGVIGTADRVAVRDWRVPHADIRGAFEPGSPPVFWVSVAADSIAHGGLGFGAASATIRGQSDSLAWFARSRVGDLSGFVGGGSLTRAPGGHNRLTLDSGAVLIPGGVWFVEQPAELQFSDSALAVHGFRLRRVNGAGRIELEGDLPASGPGAATLHVTGFPVAGLAALFQHDTLDATGTIAADVTLRGPRAAPDYDGKFAVTADSGGAPFIEGTARYAGSARVLEGTGALRRDGQSILDLTAHLPLDLALVPVARRQLPDTLSLRATAEGASLAVLEAVSSDLRNVRGTMSADVGIRGTWDAPQLRGALQLDSGAVTIPSLNVRWEGITGRLRMGGDTIHIDTLAVRSERGTGRAELGGFVRLDRLTRPLLDLSIDAHDFKALEIRGDVSTTASAALRLRGPVFGATLTGTGTVTNGVLYFADLVNKRIVDLDDPDASIASLIDTSLAAEIQRQGLGPAAHSLFIDSLQIQNLQLTMGSSVWLRSTEANIQLSGRVTVNKYGKNLTMTGQLQAPRGTYRLVVGPVTREFVVDQGTVRYFGTPDLDAGLDIEAKHVVHPVQSPAGVVAQQGGTDVTIVAHIGGTLLLPRLTLKAEGRDLSQTDIISYLMFGQPSTDLSSGDATQAATRTALLRSSVASIVSGELERTVVSDLGVPLDYLEIRPGDPNNPILGASFAAGWQIGEKTFLVVKAGYCPSAAGVANTLGASLQFRISPEWRTEASVEPVGQCLSQGTVQGLPQHHQVGADLLWERRY
jgi:translocation and assembly module TamB